MTTAIMSCKWIVLLDVSLVASEAELCSLTLYKLYSPMASCPSLLLDKARADVLTHRLQACLGQRRNLQMAQT